MRFLFQNFRIRKKTQKRSHGWYRLDKHQWKITLSKNRRAKNQTSRIIQSIWSQWKWIFVFSRGIFFFHEYFSSLSTYFIFTKILQVDKGMRDVLQSDELFDCKQVKNFINCTTDIFFVKLNWKNKIPPYLIFEKWFHFFFRLSIVHFILPKTNLKATANMEMICWNLENSDSSFKLWDNFLNIIKHLQGKYTLHMA